MKKTEFWMDGHHYSRIIKLSGYPHSYMDDEEISNYEYDEALSRRMMRPQATQSPEDLLWAIHNHVRIASN